MFRDDSIVRRINGESALLLGGGRALLMQLAHPLVAAGVDQHSGFEGDRLGRLLRTLRPTYAIVFGDERQARSAAAGIRHAHDYVSGPGYTANDPALLLWVHATLVDSSLQAYRRFVRPLSHAEAERYYLEIADMVELIGLPASALPPDLDAFDAYVAGMVATLEVGAVSRRLARAVFAPDLWLGPGLQSAAWFTAGLLPPRLREAYGLRWTAIDARMLAALEAASRAAVPRLPVPLRRPPALVMPPRPHGEVVAPISQVIISPNR